MSEESNNDTPLGAEAIAKRTDTPRPTAPPEILIKKTSPLYPRLNTQVNSEMSQLEQKCPEGSQLYDPGNCKYSDQESEEKQAESV